MSRTRRLDEVLADVDKPALENRETVGLGRDDVLVVCAGFEERSTEIVKRALAAGSRGFRVVVVEYLPLIGANRSEELRDLCVTAKAVGERVSYDRREPEGGERIRDLVLSGQGAIHVDISGMSRLLIVQCLVALREAVGDRLKLWYCEAAEYPPTPAEVDQAMRMTQDDPSVAAMFLSSGVFGVTIVPELASTTLQGAPVQLIAFPSFNTAQLVALRSEIAAARITIVHGVPPRAENGWRTAAIRRLNHVDKIINGDELEVSTLDYRATLDVLLRQYGKDGDREKLVVAPTGSKMQAVAVGLFRSFLKDVEIAYPTPANFEQPERYSSGVRGGVLAGSWSVRQGRRGLRSGNGEVVCPRGVPSVDHLIRAFSLMERNRCTDPVGGDCPRVARPGLLSMGGRRRYRPRRRRAKRGMGPWEVGVVCTRSCTR